MLHQTKNPRRALSGHMNGPQSEIGSEETSVLVMLDILPKRVNREFTSWRRGDEIDNAISAAEANVSAAEIWAMARLN